MRSVRSSARVESEVSRSPRAERSSGLGPVVEEDEEAVGAEDEEEGAERARERMRRYDVKRERVWFSWERTSLCQGLVR